MIGADEDLETVLSQYPDPGREDLIPILQDAQEVMGHLSHEAIVRIAQHLALPASKVYGVATFYNQFRFQAPGRFHIQICRGTACHVKGSQGILAALKRELRIEPGQTSRDGMFSLEVVACVGACGLAPVIVINGRFHAGVRPEHVGRILAEWRRKAKEDDAPD